MCAAALSAKGMERTRAPRGASELKGLSAHSDSEVSWSPDGLRLLTASQDRSARLWEVNRLAAPCLPCLPSPPLLSDLSLSPDPEVREAAAGSCIREFEGHTDTVQAGREAGQAPAHEVLMSRSPPSSLATAAWWSRLL